MSANDKVAATFHGADALTPEQDLRAKVAELLADAIHFGECGDMTDLAADVGVHRDKDDCTCLIGRLNWAINAEQVTA